MPRASQPLRETLAGDYRLADPFDARTFPGPRTKRPGPPPAGAAAGADPLTPRGAPIRARAFAFQLREISHRANLALPGYVGPGLVKYIEYHVHGAPNNNPQSTVNLYWSATPYVTVVDSDVTVQPKGTRMFESGIADDQPALLSNFGGLSVSGVQAGPGRYTLNYYISDENFFLCLTAHALGGGPTFITGNILVYEGVLVSDFPHILA